MPWRSWWHVSFARMARTFAAWAAAGTFVVAGGLAGCGKESAAPRDVKCHTAAGGQITVRAANVQFTKRCIVAPAGKPLKVTFVNADAGTPHDWVLKGAGKVGTSLITGGRTASVTVPPLTPGEYTYVCSVHPNMVGVLKIER